MPIRFTLVSDGSSDATLQYILKWLCKKRFGRPVEGAWFDPRPFAPPSLSLQDSIKKSIEIQPCDILFVHRDAEGENPQKRYDEIMQAAECLHDLPLPPVICVIPVRMTEAWLLFDETAIRKAASNPRGKIDLKLPSINSLEGLSDPKDILFSAIRKASELNGRRLKKLRVSRCRIRIAEIIQDFSPLRALDAFRQLEESIHQLQL